MRSWLDDHLDLLSNKHKHLANARLTINPLVFRPKPAQLSSLVNLIIGQQISVKAAEAINARIFARLGNDFTPAACLALPPEEWRALGLSNSKVNYVYDLAQHVADGRVDLAALDQKTDGEIVQILTQVKGIGRWTAENYMIFTMQRPNVWPAHDLALQEGIKRIRKLPARPNPKEMDILGAKYAPYRSAAALLIWAFLESPLLK